ncbi:MAG TPA: FtsX-like permease family protein, partial [Chryseolinea sp.]|nr:FtsX-like permease family protein [Chryseolinea sp.]
APITEQWSNTTEMEWRGKNPHENSTIERIFLDESISSTLGITVLQGRDMDLQRFASDSTAVLLNETALKIMDFKNPIGEIIIDNGREWHVIGIVKDFVFTSPFRQVEPIALFGCQAKWALNVLYLKLNGSPDLQQTLSKLSNLSKKYNPEYPFEYHFADAEYERKFDNLKTTLKITDLFTGITVFIACLGLLGLAIYTADARLKEIGIRKVMGGSVYSITKLLSLSSLKPVCIAVVLFTPVACIAMTWWLQSFAYRTNLDVWVFLTAACLILLISLITIATQTIKAAGTNPVATLRNE